MKVLCFDDFCKEPIDPRQACGSATVPSGFKITGGRRKFIVMEDESSPQKFALAIGPSLGNSYYYHKEILNVAGGSLPGFKIAGGGEVEFSCSSKHWTATFSGYSGDFGVFTPKILTPEKLSAIAEALKMNVLIQWENDASPKW